MPLSQDPKGGGTEADGSRSTEFCSYCYQNGAFFEPNMTLEQMIAKLEPIMSGMHMLPLVVEKTMATLPQLKRWRVPSVR